MSSSSDLLLSSTISLESSTTTTSTPWIHYLTTFFLIIANILGTGILGLPVKLSHSGFSPFLLTYAFGLFFQGFVLYCVVELLLRARVSRGLESEEKVRLDDFEMSVKDEDEALDIDLHTLSIEYLPKLAVVVFDFFLLFHYFTILTSYSLAGAEAYNVLINIDIEIIILIFTVTFTLVLIFLMKYIQYFISILTFTKGSLLILVVFVTMIISQASDIEYIDDWRFVGQPFLIGTVALGGGYGILPFAFKNIQSKKADVIKFLLSGLAALLFIFVLNVIWCYFFLQSIPQVGDSNITLEKSAENGEIATIPLVNIIRESNPDLEWIAICIDIFIIVSITVSFLTVGTALKHVLDGMIGSWSYSLNTVPTGLKQKVCFHFNGIHINGRKGILYGISYGLILLIALLNPEGFLVIIENGSSFALNGSALFIVIMLYYARKQNFDIVLRIPDRIFTILLWVNVTYFSIGLIYDMIVTVTQIFPSLKIIYL